MRRPASVLVVALALVAAACTSEATAPVVTTPEVTQEPTTTVAITSTTAAPTTTTTEPAEPTLEEIKAELIRVVEGADSVFLLDPIDPDTPLIDEFYAPDLGEAVRGNLRVDRDNGDSYFGTVDPIDPQEVVVEDETASITACVLDGIGSRDESGNTLVEPATQSYIVRYDFVRVGDVWLLDALFFPGSEREPCERP